MQDALKIMEQFEREIADRPASYFIVNSHVQRIDQSARALIDSIRNTGEPLRQSVGSIGGQNLIDTVTENAFYYSGEYKNSIKKAIVELRTACNEIQNGTNETSQKMSDSHEIGILASEHEATKASNTSKNSTQSFGLSSGTVP